MLCLPFRVDLLSKEYSYGANSFFTVLSKYFQVQIKNIMKVCFHQMFSTSKTGGAY